MKLSKIISGGQTGVDRAALDAAIMLNIPIGGFCPKGRRAEDGIIPDKYDLYETKNNKYSERTKQNIQHSQGTLILYWDTITNGSFTTLEYCKILNKPHFKVNMNKSPIYQIKKIYICTKWGLKFKSDDFAVQDYSLKNLEQNHGCKFFFPSIKLCTDNGAMIALAGLERYERKLFNKLTFKPRPRWPLDKQAIFMKGKRVVGI